MPYSKSQKRLILAMAFSILFWASAFVGIRSALAGGYSPGSLALLRFLVASFVLAIYAVSIRMRLPRKKDIPLILLNGFVGITIYHVALNYGEMTVKAGTASFIISSIPLLTGILSIFFFGQVLKTWGWIGLVISFSGIALISFSENNFEGFSTGTLLVFIAALGGSLYVMFQKKLLQHYTAIEVTSWSIWIGTLFMFPFITELFADIQTAKLAATINVVYLGVFPAAVAYVLWNYALNKFSSPAHITSFLYMSPIVTMIIGVIWLREFPNVFSLLGGLVVLGGVILANTKGRK